MKSMRYFLACLAAVMLAGMLAGCDGGLVGMLFWPEESVDDEIVNIEKYSTLEVEEVDFAGDISAIEYGLTTFGVFDNKELATSNVNTNEFLKMYNDVIANPDSYNWEFGNEELCMAIANVSNPDKERANMLLTYYDDSTGWEHNIVSTNYNFALESINPNGDVFLTGFVNGRLENDLGFIDKDTIKIMKEVAKNYSYNEIVNTIRQEFFAVIFVKDVEKKVVLVSWGADAVDENDNYIPNKDRDYRIISVEVRNDKKTQGILFKADYDVPENYFDVLLESGKVVDKNTEAEIETQ